MITFPMFKFGRDAGSFTASRTSLTSTAAPRLINRTSNVADFWGERDSDYNRKANTEVQFWTVTEASPEEPFCTRTEVIIQAVIICAY